MASIAARTRTDGTTVYRIAYRHDGRLRWTPTIADPAGADEMKTLLERLGPAAALAILQQRSSTTPTAPLLSDWLETHLTALGASATPGTVAEYRRMAARTWGPRLGPLPLDAISRDAVTAWVAWQRQQMTVRGKPYAPKSISNAHGLLSAALASAVDAELITRNAAKGTALPSDVEREEMVILTVNEFVTLHAALPAHWRPLVALLYGTGLRWGEATALTPGDLDLDGVTPIVRVTRAWKQGAAGVYLGSPKTRRSRRTVALPPQIVPDLRALADGKAAGDLLFTSIEGKRVSGQHFNARVWHPALAASGLTKRPRVHDLRHTHASLMIAAGMDLLQLQHRLGHESLKTTGDTYGHLMPDAHARGSAFAGPSERRPPCVRVRHQVAVGVPGRLQRLMAQPVLQLQQVHPGRDHQRGVRVPQVVDTWPLRQPGLRQGRAPDAGVEVLPADPLPLDRREQQVTRGLPVGQHAQVRDDLRRQGHGPPAASGLRAAEVHARLALLPCAGDADDGRHAVEIEVAGRESCGLTPAQARPVQERHERLPVGRERRVQGDELVGREDDHLFALGVDGSAVPLAA